jgi:chromosome segregation ATPase
MSKLLKDTQGQLDNTLTTIQELKLQLETASADSDRSINVLRNESEAKLHEHVRVVDAMKKDADELRARVQAFEAEKKAMLVDMERVKEERLTLATNNANVLQEICDLKEKMFQLKEENSSLHRQMEECRKECKRSMDRLKSDLVEELDTLERKNDDMQAREASWGVERAALQSDLERAAADKEEAFAAADQRVAEVMASSRVALKESQVKLADAAAESEAALADAEKRFAEAKSQSDALLAECQNKLASCEAALSDSEHRLADYTSSSEQALADAEQRYAESKAEYAELETKMAEVTDKYNNSVGDAERLAELLASSEEDRLKVEGEYEGVVRDKRESDAVAEEAISALRCEKDALQQELAEAAQK